MGDPIEVAENRYPELTCGSEPEYDEGPDGARYCTGTVSKERVGRFGGDPINVIVLSPSGFGD